MTDLPILPTELLIEVAMRADMFTFGALVRTCKAVWQPFKALDRRTRMSRFMTWQTREHLFYTDAYWEYKPANNMAVAHVTRLRYDTSGRILQDAEMWLGRRHGRCISYYMYDDMHALLESACVRTRAWYVDGHLHGKVFEYHDNGILWCDCNYQHGALDGEFRAYYDTGRLHQIKHYASGVAVGEWFEYARDGSLHAHGHVDTPAPRRCVIL
ncbi:hypothetical protein F-E9_35 [Faustovirus]|nr:hypothetical protein F-E9_35 [Faustovirus]